ncbi:MAG: hypothetical protein Kow00121_57620 [Elainellaceae cyanobacterium]
MTKLFFQQQHLLHIAKGTIAFHNQETLQYLLKQELRRRINEALISAQDLPPDQCLHRIKERFSAIQAFCQDIGKTFVVVESQITCNQYDLGGSSKDTATLLRGPDQAATVAVCVTQKGSLLHRNSCPWKIYRNVGDVNPIS